MGREDKLLRAQIELLEVSQVSVPANSGAVQLAAKALERLAEKATRPAGGGVKLREIVETQILATIRQSLAELRQDVAAQVEDIKFIIASTTGDHDALEPDEDLSPSSVERTDAAAAGETRGNVEMIGTLEKLIDHLKDH